jgi:hypothetical protein
MTFTPNSNEMKYRIIQTMCNFVMETYFKMCQVFTRILSVYIFSWSFPQAQRSIDNNLEFRKSKSLS